MSDGGGIAEWAKGEAAVIARTEAALGGPVTYRRLVADLQALGIPPGRPVIVHSSLSAIGWVAGGPVAVVDAIVDALAPATVVVPTQSSDRSDPRWWRNPAVPPHWLPAIREHTPAFDPLRVESRGMGRIVEAFRTDRRAVRGPHPTVSFAAIGPDAARLVSPHDLVPQFGDPSPLGRLYQADAVILQLGVTHATNTSLHLAETRATWPGKPGPIEDGAALLVDGRSQWVAFDGEMADSGDFEALGEAFMAAHPPHEGRVGIAPSRWCSMVAAVDFATPWFTTHRGRAAN